MQTYGNTVEEYELVKMAFHYNALLKLDRLCDSGQGWTIVQGIEDKMSKNLIHDEVFGLLRNKLMVDQVLIRTRRDRLCDSGQGGVIVQSGGDNKSTKGSKKE